MVTDKGAQYWIFSWVANRSDCGLMFITLDRSFTSLLHHHPDDKYVGTGAKNPSSVVVEMEKLNQSYFLHLILVMIWMEVSYLLISDMFVL